MLWTVHYEQSGSEVPQIVTYLLIAFIIALALAPLVHFVPSKKQRRVARLREYAAIQGLFVEFRSLPGPRDTAAVRSATQDGNIIYYGRRIPATGRRQEAPTGIWRNGPEGWSSLLGDAVPGQLSGLPDGILAAGLDENSCGIYWQESGEEADIDQINRVLVDLSAKLSS